MNKFKERLRRIEERVGADKDQILLVWCKPSQDMAKVLRKEVEKIGMPPPSEMWPQSAVLCCCWTAEDEMPAPRWTTIEKMGEDELRIVVNSTRDRLLADGLMTQEQWDEMDARHPVSSTRAGGRSHSPKQKGQRIRWP